MPWEQNGTVALWQAVLAGRIARKAQPWEFVPDAMDRAHMLAVGPCVSAVGVRAQPWRRSAAAARGAARQSVGEGDEPVPVAARAQPRRLVSLGRRGTEPRRKREKKLIFLSIGYSSCYWCHVMERESFMDDEIAARLNKDFVCIKVDREERPDIDEIYMQALHVYMQLIGSKQGGGWPLSMFLTPDAKPLMGGTYFPPRDKEGRMGFLTVLQRVGEAWTAEPEKWQKTGDSLTDYVAESLRQRPMLQPVKLNAAAVDSVLRAGGAVRRRRTAASASIPPTPGRRNFPSRPTCSSCSTTCAATRPRRHARCWSRLWKKSRRAAFATTSAADSIATAPTASGACRTSKRCSTTTANWPPCMRWPTNWRRATTSSASSTRRSSSCCAK